MLCLPNDRRAVKPIIPPPRIMAEDELVIIPAKIIYLFLKKEMSMIVLKNSLEK